MPEVKKRHVPTLLEMPMVPMKRILNCFHPATIFIFSLSSPSTRQRITNVGNLKATQIKWLFGYQIVKIFVTFKNRAYQPLEIRMKKLAKEQWAEKMSLVEKRHEKTLHSWMAGVPVLFRNKSKNLLEIYHNQTDSLLFRRKFCKTISQKVRSVFSRGQLHAETHLSRAKAFLPMLEDLPRPLDSLRAIRDTEISTLSVGELRQLLEGFKVDAFFLKWPLVNGAVYDGKLNYRKMELHNANWLNLDCLLRLDSEILVTSGTPLTLESLNEFVREWIDGRFRRLRIVHVRHEGIGQDYGVLLRGIDSAPIDKTIRRGNGEQECPKEGRDIRRADGTLASVHLDPRLFRLLIWK